MRLFRNLLFLIVIGAGFFWWFTKPKAFDEASFAEISGDPAHGRDVFYLSGCASCHMAEGAEGEAQLILSGGQSFPSNFGTFKAPNISQDPEYGIGDWSLTDLANAVYHGRSPEGEHYYPALPYAAYNKLKLQDIADLYAFMKTLPAAAIPSQDHELSFPFNQRILLGGWKMLYNSNDWALPGDLPEPADRGRYIAEAMAHCAECHTPRTALGGLDRARWMAGVNPEARGGVPGLTPAQLDWSEDEIATYLTTGFTPDYDSVGGHMAHVVANFSALPESYAQDVAAYLKALPAVP